MDENTKKPRKARVDSVANTAAAMAVAHRQVNPPGDVSLNIIERHHFDEIIADLPKIDLTEHQVTVAALLAKTMYSLVDQQTLLRDEGFVVTTANGNRKPNPRVAITNQLTATLLSLRRSLGLHARALAGGDLRLTGIRNGHNLNAEQNMNDLDDDDLIARPNVLPFNRKDS